MNKKISTILLLMFLSSTPLILAETIVLKSGKSVEGKIIEKTDKSIKVDIEGIIVTYYLDEIENINSDELDYSVSRGTPKIDKTDETVLPNDAVHRMYSDMIHTGVMYCKQGQYEQGINRFKEAINVDPNISLAYENLGHAYDHIGKRKEAIEMLEKAAQLNPSSASVYQNLGNAYANSRRYKEAKESFQKAKELSERSGDFESVKVAEQGISAVLRDLKDQESFTE